MRPRPLFFRVVARSDRTQAFSSEIAGREEAVTAIDATAHQLLVGQHYAAREIAAQREDLAAAWAALKTGCSERCACTPDWHVMPSVSLCLPLYFLLCVCW
jgi:hypothetical protein